MSPHARAQTAFWRARARSKRDPYLVFPNITSIFEVNVSRCPHNVKSRVQWKMKACLIVECCGCMMHFMFFHSNSDLLSMHNIHRLKSKICKQENWVYNSYFSLYVLWSWGWNFPPLSEFRPLMLCFLIVFFKGVCTIQSSYYLLNISLIDNYSQMKLHWSIFND